jgi:hypothetical protein
MSLIGIAIGFYGYLFPGNINLMVMYLYKEKKYTLLLFIFLLILLFESVYCFFVLFVLDEVNLSAQWYSAIETFAYLMTMGMGLWMLFEKKSPKQAGRSNIYRGIISIVVHPQQIPFWLLIAVLFHDIIGSKSLMSFIFFNAIGTGLILFAYAFLGNKLLQLINLNLRQINRIIGIFYILFSIFSFIKKI